MKSISCHSVLDHVSFLVLCVTLLFSTLDLFSNGVNRAEAAGLRVLSAEYPRSKESTVEKRVVVDGEAQHCLLFSLSDETLFVSVRFAYSSNITFNARHFPLVVTTHFPSVPYAGGITYHDERNIMDTHVFEVSDLLFDPNSDIAKEGKRKKVDVKMHVRRTDASGATATENTPKSEISVWPGSYGMCFGLDNPFFNGATNYAPEQVIIDVLGVEFGREAVHGRPGGPQGGVQRGNLAPRSRQALVGADEDANSAFEEGVRKLYRAEDDADVQKLIKNRELLPSAMLRKQLELADEALQKVNRVQDLARWQREREQDMRKTSESTFTRIWISGVLLFAAVSVATHLIFSFAKSFMIKQKLI